MLVECAWLLARHLRLEVAVGEAAIEQVAPAILLASRSLHRAYREEFLRIGMCCACTESVRYLAVPHAPARIEWCDGLRPAPVQLALAWRVVVDGHVVGHVHPIDAAWERCLASRSLREMVDEARGVLARVHDGCVAPGDFTHLLDDLGVAYGAAQFYERDVAPMREWGRWLRARRDEWRRASRRLGYARLFG